MIEIRYEAFLTRIEVILGRRADADDADLSWRVSADDRRDNTLVLRGYVKVSNPEGTGRALVHGIVAPRSEEEAMPKLGELLQSTYVEGCVEAMYDTARRTLNMQAALMDFAFEMPYKAPDTEIRPAHKASESA